MNVKTANFPNKVLFLCFILVTEGLLSIATKLDPIAWHILEILQTDARLSFAEIGRRVGLSTPAVAERVRKLEEAGVILGYHALVDPVKLGISLQVIIRLTIHGGETTVKKLLKEVKTMREVRQCYRVTGSDSFILKADVVSIQHLNRLIERLFHFGETSTTTVLSTPVMRRNYMIDDMQELAQEDELDRSA
jgi:Lrp/AsnC family leucine-responsive transcriptional regulator